MRINLTAGQRKVLNAVVQYIRREQMRAEDRLSELQLAKLVGTSRSPVRVALELLTEQGVTRYDRNRGYFLAIDACDIPTIVIEDELVSDEDPVYLTIARWRFERKLNDSVTEADLSRLIGVSRAEVHRALTRAQAEGWASRAVGYGWEFVPTVDTLDAYDDLYAVRLALEPSCLLSPKFRPVKSELLAIKEEQQAIASGKAHHLTPVEIFESNSRFHATIVSWSRNTVAIDILRRLDRVRRLTEYHQAGRQLPRRELAQEHLNVLEAVERGDTLLAASLLREHLDGSRRRKAVAEAFPVDAIPVSAEISFTSLR